MVFRVIVDMQVKPEMVEAHIERLKVALPETSKAEGCIELVVTRDQDQPTHFMVLEAWSSRGAFEAYRAWRSSTGSLDAMQARLAAPLKFYYLDTVVTTATPAAAPA